MKTNSPLPTGWIQMPLGNCGTWHGGGTPSKFNDAYWTNGTIPWISPKDMKTLRITDSEDHLAQLAIEETNVKPFPSGTVLVVIRSGILSRTLPVAVSQVIGTMNQDLKGLLPIEGIDSDFVAYFLQAFEQDILRKCSKHGTTVASIDTASLHSYPLSIAPLNEQRRIVAKIEELFSDLDAGVAALERAKANLKRFRAAVLKAAVEGKLTEEWRAKHPATEPASALVARILKERRQKWEADQLAKFATAKKEPPKNWRDKYVELSPPDTEGLLELPQGWCWASVDQLGDVQLGRQRSPKNRSDEFPTKYIRAANLTETGLDLTDVMDMEFMPHELETYRLHPGDVLLSEASGSPDQVGKPVVWKGEIEDCCFQNTVIRLRPVGIASEYALTVFRHYYRSKLFAKVSAGVGINHLSAGKFSALPFPIAPLAEQEQIVAEVEEKLSLIGTTDKQIASDIIRASRLRQSILKQAFEGKLVPQDPNDEPASVLLERLRASRSDHDAKNRAKANVRPAKQKKSERLVDK